MGSVYLRRRRWWMAFKGSDGKRALRKTPFLEDQREKAEALLEEVERQVAAGIAAVGVVEGPLTVKRYSETWVKARRESNPPIATADADQHRLEAYILPTLGNLPIGDVRPRHVIGLIRGLRTAAHLAPGSIWNVYSTVKAMFRDARAAELVAQSPAADLPTGTLPPREDADLSWREGAVFTREEGEILISDTRIPEDRRALYALKLVGFMRHGEAAGISWGDYDAAAEPLGKLSVSKQYAGAATKTRTSRAVPVHPTLAKVLAAWRLSGWEACYGHRPKASDLIVPNGRMKPRDVNDAAKLLAEDLALLKMRPRRGHDMRATGMTLAIQDGALPHILSFATHGKKSRRGSIDAYTRPQFPAICAEVGKLKLELREGKVIEMPKAAAGGGGDVGGGEGEDVEDVLHASYTPPKSTGSKAEKTKPRVHHAPGAPPKPRGRPSISRPVCTRGRV